MKERPRAQPFEDSSIDDAEDACRTWSRAEAATWRAGNPSLSPWRVVALQVGAGAVCGAVAYLLTQRIGPAVSALYGALAVVVPNAMLARGMSRSYIGVPGAVGHAVFRFVFWELVKIGVAVAMLLAAPKVVPGLDWLTMLVTMIVCMKMNLVALLWQRRPQTTGTKV